MRRVKRLKDTYPLSEELEQREDEQSVEAVGQDSTEDNEENRVIKRLQYL